MIVIPVVLFVFNVFVLVRSAPAAGSCLCLTTTSVHIRDAPNLHGHILTSVSTGECFKFHGGVHTEDGYTWYQLQNVYGHNTAWIASNYVQTSSDSHCTAHSSGQFATGMVSQECLHCICMQESGCKPIACHYDVNSDSCGYFQIKEVYWIDCGKPGGSWHQCASDIHCSSQCVQNNMHRYAAHFNCPLTCEGYARIHNGGPNGCHKTATLSYWQHVQNHPGCHGVQ